MACSTNQKVQVKNRSKFDDWLHVIYNQIVMKVYKKDECA